MKAGNRCVFASANGCDDAGYAEGCPELPSALVESRGGRQLAMGDIGDGCRAEEYVAQRYPDANQCRGDDPARLEGVAAIDGGREQ